MKRVIAFAAAGGLLLFGAFAFLSATAPNTAEAQEGTAPDSGVKHQATILERLVEAGLITQDQADDIAERLPEAREELKELLEEVDFSDLKEHFADRDRDAEDRVKRFFYGFDWDSLEEQFEGFDLDDLNLEDLQLPEGFELPEGFNLEDLQKRFENFDLDDLSKRYENFDFERFRERRLGDGFGGLFEGVTPDELRDAIENGTLDQLIDLDELIAQAEARHQEMLEKLAESGRFTNEQLAEMQERFDQHLEKLEEALESGEFDFRSFRGFRGPHGPGAEDASTDQASLSA